MAMKISLLLTRPVLAPQSDLSSLSLYLSLSLSFSPMDSLGRFVCFYLLTASFFFSQARAHGTASVFFVDSSTHRFLRSPSTNDVVFKPDSMSLSEVSAAVSVLLGFAPSASLTAAGSSKLNEVLAPNPFNRPRAVFILEVRGTPDPNLAAKENSIFKSAYETSVDLGLKKAEIELPDESEVSVFSLDEKLADCTDNELSDFASWMGGSYVADAVEKLNGEMTIPLVKGDQLKLHMSKEADRKFTTGLLVLVRNIRRAMELHEDLVHSSHSPAELLIGSFDGIKVLVEQYGSEGVAQHGMELLVAAMTKIFGSLEHAYKGQIVGAILFNEVAPVESGKMLNVKYTSRPSARWLEETKIPSNTTIVEVMLVRRTLAWITGIILLVSTLLGVCFLFKMPITKDTLLYSNVKLD